MLNCESVEIRESCACQTDIEENIERLCASKLSTKMSKSRCQQLFHKIKNRQISRMKQMRCK